MPHFVTEMCTREMRLFNHMLVVFSSVYGNKLQLPIFASVWQFPNPYININCLPKFVVYSPRPGDWCTRHWIRPSMIKIMGIRLIGTQCHTEPSSKIIPAYWQLVPKSTFKLKLSQIESYLFMLQENAVEYDVCKMVAILSQPLYVNKYGT